MASSLEAFEKLDMWKNSNTLLNLTVESQPSIRQRGHIFHVDEELDEVGFVDEVTRDHVGLVLRGANFTIGERTLEARRPGEGRVLLEECLVS